MTASLPTKHTGIHALDFMDEGELIRALESSLYPGAKEASIKLVIANCRAQTLDPMTKPFHIVPMQVKQKKQSGNGFDFVWRDVVMPGIELYRTKAARTECYAGIDEAKWGNLVELVLGGEDKTEWDDQARAKVKKGNWATLKLEVPEWCEVTVYRIVQGTRYAFSSGRVYWEESYATAGRETSLPNEMWKKRRRGQLEKCAEALALRRGFPELGATPTAEEMEGKIIDNDAIEGTVVSRTVEQPPQKSEASTSTTAPANPDSSATAAEPRAGGGGEASDKQPPEDKSISDGARATLRSALKRAGKTELDLETAGFGKIDEMRFSKFNDAMAWAKKPAATATA